MTSYDTRLELSVDSHRMFERIEALARINRLEDGSCCRLALTDADCAGRQLVMQWMQNAGLKIRIDQIGNIIGVRAGLRDAPPVMTGSHLDTVASGGAYDGVLGVVAGLEALERLNEAGLTTAKPLALSIFTNEEGARFQPDMMGSLVFAGGLPLEEALAATAEDGVSVADELQRTGFSGKAPCGELRPCAFVELHIEQGPILDREDVALGVVTDLQGISWRELSIRGAANHAGTTPMSMRSDAGYCAARTAVFVRELANRMGGSQVGTVGSIRLEPNLINVIPRLATVSVDLRNTQGALLASADRELDKFLKGLKESEGVEITSRRLVRTGPVVFDERVVAIIECVARDLSLPIRRMTSGAGHDAQMMARVCPSAMIFVPSRGGVSHSAKEFTEPVHLEAGANTLLQTMWRLAA